MSVQSIIIGTWKLLIAIRISVGLVPAVTPRILSYFIYFYGSCHKVFSSGWNGEPSGLSGYASSVSSRNIGEILVSTQESKPQYSRV